MNSCFLLKIGQGSDKMTLFPFSFLSSHEIKKGGAVMQGGKLDSDGQSVSVHHSLVCLLRWASIGDYYKMCMSNECLKPLK